MASSQNHLPNSQENEEKGLNDKSDPIRNSEVPLRRELSLRRELHGSFDLNQISPTPLESGNPGHFPYECRDGDQNKVGDESLIEKDTSKKRPRSADISFSSDTKDDDVTNSEIDLELRLSSPNASFSSTPQEIILPENNAPHNLKLKQEDSDFVAPNVTKVPSLLLMGCSICYIYVMVNENDPKCPKCGRCNLIDAFRGSSRAKRSRN